MALTLSQQQALRASIVADPALVNLLNASDPSVRTDNAQLIADTYNTPDDTFTVWRTTTEPEDIANAIVWANFTPSATPDNTQTWANRALQCQGKQFNLQNLFLSLRPIRSNKVNIRNAFQDCLTQIPSGAAGANQAAGWNAVQTAMQRKATRAEKLYATGTGTPADPANLVYEGDISGSDVLLAWEFGV